MALSKTDFHVLDMLPHLAARAQARKTITYKELGSLVGVMPRFLGKPLGRLRDDILTKHNLPRLDALVVNIESGEAGSDFFDGGMGGLSADEYHVLLNDAREEVFAYERWDEIVRNLHAYYGGEEYRKAREAGTRSV